MSDAVRVARRLALGAIVGPILFDVAAISAGLMRPGYSLVARPVSALAVGPDGVYVRGAFELYGALVTVGILAALGETRRELQPLARWVCMVLLAISPLGVLVAGIFTMDPSTLGLHMIGVQLAVTTPILALPSVGVLLRRAPTWRRLGTWMLLGGPLTLLLLVGFMQSIPFTEMVAGGGRFGLWQRALLLEVQGWYVAVTWQSLRRGDASAR
jgi:hypothetical protein